MRDGILALHIATGSFGLILGPIAMLAPKRRRRPGWLPTHIAGMGGSYIALTTAVLVVNLGAGTRYANRGRPPPAQPGRG